MNIASLEAEVPNVSASVGDLQVQDARAAKARGPGGLRVWNARAQRFLEKNTSTKKITALRDLERRRAILTERIESLKQDLKSAGWKRRGGRGPCEAKAPYPDEVVNRLRTLAQNERAQAIRELAAQEGIDKKSVYRKLQRCLLWANRRLMSQASGAAE
jgi:uncharacterized protein YPO0396